MTIFPPELLQGYGDLWVMGLETGDFSRLVFDER